MAVLGSANWDVGYPKGFGGELREKREWKKVWGKDGAEWPRGERIARARRESFKVGWPEGGEGPGWEEVSLAFGFSFFSFVSFGEGDGARVRGGCEAGGRTDDVLTSCFVVVWLVPRTDRQRRMVLQPVPL